jgi:hypothetical protein
VEPALRFFVPAVLGEPHGHLQRRVEEQFPVVERVRVIVLERDVEVRRRRRVKERARPVVPLEPRRLAQIPLPASVST